MDDRPQERKLTDIFGKPLKGYTGIDIYDAKTTGKLCGDAERDKLDLKSLQPDLKPDMPPMGNACFGKRFYSHAEELETVEYSHDILRLAGVEDDVTFETDSASNQISTLLNDKFNDFEFDLSGDDCVLINKVPTKIQTGFLKDLYVGFTGTFGHSKAVEEIVKAIEHIMSDLFLLNHIERDTEGDNDGQLLDKEKER